MLSEEEKKAIKFFERRMDICIENANICDENNFDEEAESLRKEQSYIDTILNLITRLEKENEHQIEKRNNQKAELAILNEKQKDMNKLINDVKTYKGQFKRQEKEIQKYKYLYQKALDNTVKSDKENIQLKKQIDLMTEEIRKTILIVKSESKFCQYEEDCKNIRCKDCIKQFFEKQAKEKGE